jgi:hypothetical protein
MKRSIIAALALLSVAGSTLAQSPQTAFTYQGQMKQSGAAATGTYDFHFQLYDAASGGSAASGIAAVIGVPVEDGLFSAQVDFGPVNLGAAPRWIEIRVRPSGQQASFTTLAPRQPLTPAPLASKLALPYTASASTQDPLFTLWQNGNAPAATFHGVSAAGTAATVSVQSSGQGNALEVNTTRGAGAAISVGSESSKRALTITSAGTGEGLSITKTNPTNDGPALMIQAQTQTATAINVVRGHIKRSYAAGQSPAVATPIAYAKYKTGWDQMRTHSGNVSVQYVNTTNGYIWYRFSISNDSFPEDWVVTVTPSYEEMPASLVKILVREPNEYGQFLVGIEANPGFNDYPLLNVTVHRR